MTVRQNRQGCGAMGASLILGLAALWLPVSHAHAQSARQEGLCQPVHEALDLDGTHSYDTASITSRHVELARGCVARGDRLGVPSLGFMLIWTGQLNAARQLVDSADRRNVDAAAFKRLECLVLRNEKKPQAAVQACEESLRLDPGLAMTYVTLANAQEETGNLDATIETLRKGSAAHPGNYMVCSALYEKLRFGKQLPANDFLPVLRRCHAIAPQLPEVVAELTWALQAARPSRLQESIEVASRLLAGERKPFYPPARYAETHYQRGHAHKYLKNMPAALADFTEAIRLGSQSERLKDYLTDRGGAYVDMGPDKADLALADLRKAVEIDPKHALAHRNLGELHMNQRNLLDARIAFDVSLALNDKDGEAWSLSGRNHLRMNNFQQAATHLQRAVQLLPGHSGAWHNLGIAYHNMGQYREALPYLTRALEQDSQNNATLFWRARTHSSLGMNREAEADYTSLIAVNPGYLWAYRNRADLRMQRADYAGAHADFTKTADTHPRELAMDWFFWAWSGLESGQPADQLLQRVEREAPGNDASALWARVLLLAQQKQSAAASDLHDGALDTLATYRYSSSASKMVVRILLRDMYSAAADELVASEEAEERYRNWNPPRFNCPFPSFNLSTAEVNRRLQQSSRCVRAWKEAMKHGDVRALLGSDFDRISPHTLRIVEQKVERAWEDAQREIEGNHEELARENSRRRTEKVVDAAVETMNRAVRNIQPVRRTAPARPVYVLPGMR